MEDLQAFRKTYLKCFFQVRLTNVVFAKLGHQEVPTSQTMLQNEIEREGETEGEGRYRERVKGRERERGR